MKRFHLSFLLILVMALSPGLPTALSQGGEVILGDEQFALYLPLLEGKRVALFSNQSGIVGDHTEPADVFPEGTDPLLVPFGQGVTLGEHILDALIRQDVHVTAVFSPEHGFRGEAGAGESVSSSVDEKTGVPILSLYSGNSRRPSDESMNTFDVLLVDIQDVGLRYYTYYISMYRLMDACAAWHKPVIILDRPNPNGYFLDGPMLEERFRSGVGVLPLPVVHGMTLGELARMINGEGWLEAGRNALDLTVIPCRNYTHQTHSSLICAPSPNLKTMKSVLLYPSLCPFENTVVSVGRGTDHPFEIYGSPYLRDTEGFSFTFVPESRPGASSPVWEGETCYGKDLRDMEPARILESGIQLDILTEAWRAVSEACPGVDFFGRPDSQGRYYLDKLMGTDQVRLMIMAGCSAEEIRSSWQEGLNLFRAQRKPYLLYEE